MTSASSHSQHPLDEANRQALLHTVRQLLMSVADLWQLAGSLTTTQQNDIGKLQGSAEHLLHFLETYRATAHHRASGTASPLHELRNLAGICAGYSELIAEEYTSHRPGSDNTIDRITRLIANLLQQIDPACSAMESSNPGKLSSSTDSAVTKGSLLVIDDNEDNRTILCRYLQNIGHDTLAANSGEQALEILQWQAVDLIFLDLIMPGLSGFDVLTKLKEDEQLRAIPIIILSGFQDTDDVIRCIQAGAEDYLYKPFNPVLLKARLNSGLQRKRWHDKELAYQRELERNQRFIRNTFGRYLSDDIVDALLENPEGLNLGGSLRKVTILMADIRGFTAICEKLPAEQVVSLLNNYLGSLSEIIMQHGGTVDEFIGDAILALFGAPIRHEDDTERAVRCALAMQREMASVNAKNAAMGLPAISIGIGLNSGNVIAGNIGSEKRSKYGIVGHEVNVTARIESYTNSEEILASKSVVQELQGRLQIGRQFSAQAKGIVDPVEIYQILGIVEAPHC